MMGLHLATAHHAAHYLIINSVLSRAGIYRKVISDDVADLGVKGGKVIKLSYSGRGLTLQVLACGS